MHAVAEHDAKTTLPELGARVRAWRARRGMTRKQLAADSGLSERFLADVETGKGNVSINSLEMAARALNITILELLQDAPRAALSRVQNILGHLDDGQLDQAYLLLSNAFGLGAEKGRDKRIALIGLRGAGKSTLGAQLAAQRSVPFIELDREIEREAGTSMNEILLLHGQAGYRRYERRALLRIAEVHADGVVMTTGGSIVSERETFDLLHSRFYCVWLKASPEEHMSRVVAQGDMRPFDATRGASGEAMEDLRRILASRESLYARADAVVDTAARSVKQSMKDLERAVPLEKKMNAMTEPLLFTQGEREMVRFATHPSRYQHWTLAVEGDVARLKLDINEDGGIKPGYKLKLNSYDLGVDIELHDALNRVRFEHPAVKVVVFESGKEKIWCSGANIYMLGLSTHGWKVNFCKFTNETRNGLEDSSRHDGLKSLAAVTGACAGGGYELALACDRIVMVDDRSSTVSLPEVPLLGVLPGTGGLTRVTDKRKVRRDLADIFCTTSEGVRADRARDWKLIDDLAKPQQFAQLVQSEVQALRQQSTRAGTGAGIELTPVKSVIDEKGYHYECVDAQVDRNARVATITVNAPATSIESTPTAFEAAGANWWPLKLARELDDAILNLRTNEAETGTWVLKTRGDAVQVMQMDAVLQAHKDHWLVRETIGLLRRTLARLDVTSRSLIALVDGGSCFAGTYYELALACDRIYMLDLPDSPDATPALQLNAANFGRYPAVNDLTRLQTRFCEDVGTIKQLQGLQDSLLRADQSLGLGLVTLTPDDIDWDDEIRIMLEERASLSPDAMTGLEASLRFPGKETMETRIFGRLSAWQNWIFIRPNAVGEEGALKLFGTGKKAKFDWKRI